MQCDRFALKKQLQKLSQQKTPSPEAAAELDKAIQASADRLQKRRDGLPELKFDKDLPIFERKEEIATAIQNNQVVVISGETGSGKSTQLPLIAMEAGFGISGTIGHTQPRRIAARGVAARIAQQLGSAQGTDIGFKIRFDDKTSQQTYVKLMTDGILLAETQSDRFLDQYDLIIIDEAHERSLNIDFLLGCLTRVLNKRPELRLIITSATINTQSFSNHFAEAINAPVPIISVEGRTYPVDILYRAPAEEETQQDPLDLVVDTVRELAEIDGGDSLIFLPTEADIRMLAKKLRDVNLSGPRTEVLPLYARLSTDQQNLIFNPGNDRRIVLATNVAESSITVPRIRYVIDTGTARISHYSPRSKVQRLPIQAVSQASANQRAGRCGRIGPGICVRLYSQEDFEQRPKFTTPEIRRTNLASVILQTLALNLGQIEEFPFIDPPRADSIRDGYKTLFEISAIDERRKLTKLGRRLARLPVDPRIGRMIFAADRESCLSEILIIAAALEIQDPRVRPAEKKGAADEQHEKFKDEKSDFISLLNIWDFYHKLKSDLSRGKLKKACERNFLSYSLMRQWQDIHRQLKAMVAQQRLKSSGRKNDYDAIHRSLLTGLLSGIATLTDRHEYTGAGGIKFNLWPGSGIFNSKPKWVMVSEIVETTKRYGRVAAKINPDWIEPIAAHIVKKRYADPRWSKKQQSVMASEHVSLFGIPIVAGRAIHYGRIDAEEARDVFIRDGLNGEEFTGRQDFYLHNQWLLEELSTEAAKTRVRDLIVDPQDIVVFYQRTIPADVFDTRSLNKKIKDDDSLDQQLRMTRVDILPQTGNESTRDQFPDEVTVGSMQIPIAYQFAPGADDDGATVRLPVEGIGQLDDAQTGWLVPGLMKDRIIGLIRSLPKQIRRNVVPAPETADQVIASMEMGKGFFNEAVAKELTRIGGVPITVQMFKQEKVSPHLHVNLEVVDDTGEVIAKGRSVAEVRSQLGAEHASSIVDVQDSAWHQDSLTEWSWGEFPKEVTITRGATRLSAFPAIVDQDNAVGLRLVDSPAAGDKVSRQGLVRLLQILHRKSVKAQVAHLPNLDQHAVKLSRVLSSKTLRPQLADLIVRIAFIHLQKVPRSEESFDVLQAGAVQKLSMAAQEVSKWLPRFAASVHQAYLQMESIPANRSPVKGDIKAQITSLTLEHFLATTSWEWLKEYPRFFEAIAFRIEKLASTPVDVDQMKTLELEHYWNQYHEVKARQEAQSVVDPELDWFRWMIEEYRVSLFAQTLGTSVTVSSKRLEKQFAKIRQV